MAGEGAGVGLPIAPVVGFGFLLRSIFGGKERRGDSPTIPGSLYDIQQQALAKYGLPAPGPSAAGVGVLSATQPGGVSSTTVPQPPGQQPTQTEEWLRAWIKLWLWLLELRRRRRMGWFHSDTGWGDIIGGALQGIGSILAPRQPSYGYPTYPGTPPYYPSPVPQIGYYPPGYSGLQLANAPMLPALPTGPSSGFGGLYELAMNEANVVPSGVTCIYPRPRAAGVSWPSTVNVQAGPGKILTYVKAPRVSYRVTVRGRRRRGCR